MNMVSREYQDIVIDGFVCNHNVDAKQHIMTFRLRNTTQLDESLYINVIVFNASETTYEINQGDYVSVTGTLRIRSLSKDIHQSELVGKTISVIRHCEKAA